MKIIAPQWAERMQESIDYHRPIDETTAFTKAIQWLIVKLSKENTPFKLYNIGAGVKRITTNTETCPCCKKPL